MAKVHDRIKELRIAANMTQEELAAKMCATKGAVGNYETGKRTPNLEVLEAIADIFNVEIDYLVGRTNVLPEYSLEEQWIIECYRKTNKDTQAAVKTILRELTHEQIETKKELRIIPLFPAAAGPGEPIDGEVFDNYETDNEKADFAVRISGDSMEPEFSHGDIVLCKKKVPEIGEIAVMMVNGFLLVKQYIADNFGNIYLRSINRKRSNLDIDILASGNDSVQGWGTVIHKRIPLVEQ